MVASVVVWLRALTGAPDALGHVTRDVHGHVSDLGILETVPLLKLMKQEHHGTLNIRIVCRNIFGDHFNI